MTTEAEAKGLVALSCLLLDEEKFDRYLDLFSGDCRYRITAYSPDLRKDMVWLDLGRVELETLLGNLPRHVRMPGRLMRHVNGFVTEQLLDTGCLAVTTALLVIHTDIEGISRVFATGRYRDTIEVNDGQPRIREREVRLDTRQFGPGCHVPM